MSTKTLISGFILLLNLSVSAQDNKFGFLSDTLKKGFYMSFEEFKDNSPSIFVECTLRTNPIFKPGHFKDHTLYKIILAKGARINKKQIWGFCDGKDFYIKSSPDKMFFDKIIYMGRYCYYKQTYWLTPWESITSNNSEPIIIIQKAINMNNGKNFPLNEKNLEFIISRDEEIFSRYLTDRKREKHYFDYLKEYSERRKEELR